MANYYGSSFTYGGTIGDQYGYGSGAGSAGSQSNHHGSSAGYGAYPLSQPDPASQYGPYGQKMVSPGGSVASVYESGYGSALSNETYRTQQQYGAGSSGAAGYYRQGNGSVDRTPVHAVSGYSPYSHSGGTRSDSGGSSGVSRTPIGSRVGSTQYGGSGSVGRQGSDWMKSDTPSSSAKSEPSVVEAVVYSAAANMLQGGRTGGGGQRMNWKERFRVNGPPDPSQWKYCELCKCSCAGPQAYKMHLEGRAHKKKEQLTASMESGSGGGGSTGGKAGGLLPGHHFCPVCDVTCSSADAYAAHIRGAKHQKIVKLQVRMGKEVPGLDSEVASAGSSSAHMVKVGPGGKKVVMAAPKISFVGGTKLQSTAQGMLEVADESHSSGADSSGSLIGPVKPESAEDDTVEEGVQAVGLEYIEESMNATQTAVQFYCKLCDCSFTDAQAKLMHSKGRRHRLAYKKKVDPTLKVDLKPNVSSGHLARIKRQRTNVKEPWLQREIRNAYKAEAEALMYEREVLQWQLMKTMGCYDVTDTRPMGLMGGAMGMMGGAMGMMGGASNYAVGRELSLTEMRPNLKDERDLMTKHNEIYPTDAEIVLIKKTMEDCEKGLKMVSDFLFERDNPQKSTETTQCDATGTDQKAENNDKSDEDKSDEAGNKGAAADSDKQQQAAAESDKQQQAAARALKGVMRAGPLAKTLLLRGQLDLDVIVLCSEVPTKRLLHDICEHLPVQLQKFSENKYSVKLSPDGSRIVMTHLPADEAKGQLEPVPPQGPLITCYISLTSPSLSPTAGGPQQATAVEGQAQAAAPARAAPAIKPTGGLGALLSNQKGGKAVVDKLAASLDEKMCLDALAALRRVKWFQAKVSSYQAGPIVVRIMMDFCRRVPTWNPVNQWAIEQLVERALSSLIAQQEELSPVKALHKVFEIVSSGILLADGPGLRDPCEKEERDVMEDVPLQEREDITNSAQHALRMIAFGQLRRVLNLQIQIPTELLSTATEGSSEAQGETETGDNVAEGGAEPTISATASGQPASIPPAKRQKCNT